MCEKIDNSNSVDERHIEVEGNKNFVDESFIENDTDGMGYDCFAYNISDSKHFTLFVSTINKRNRKHFFFITNKRRKKFSYVAYFSLTFLIIFV